MNLPHRTDESFSIAQSIALIWRNLGTLLAAMILCGGAAFVAAEYLPKRYRSTAVLNIQSAYFQHPLVSNLVSEVREPSEMSAQRLSLLRLALNDEFLDRLGDKYGIYENPKDSPLRAIDRELFLKRIKYISISPTSFQISTSSKNPEDAFEIIDAVLDQMKLTITQQRYQMLLKARDAILSQAKLLSRTLSEGLSSPQQETLRAELAKMEANLAELRTRYTERHPEVVAVRSRTEALRSRIQKPASPAKPQPENGADDYTRVFLSPASRVSTQEIFDDLLKKLSHLNVVLEMERDRNTVSYLAVIEQPSIPVTAYFPNRVQFALIGALAGMVLGGVRVVFTELERARRYSPQRAAQVFDLELLGELPALRQKDRVLLLGSNAERRLMALPVPGGS